MRDDDTGEAVRVLRANVRALLAGLEWSIARAVSEAQKRGLSVTNGTLGRMVQGAVAPTLTNIEEVGKLLGATPAQLLTPGLHQSVNLFDPEDLEAVAQMSPEQRAALRAGIKTAISTIAAVRQVPAGKRQRAAG